MELLFVTVIGAALALGVRSSLSLPLVVNGEVIGAMNLYDFDEPEAFDIQNRRRAETWAFGADEVAGVRRIPRAQWGPVPSTLANPAVGFSRAILAWEGRRVGLLDEQRVFSALREVGA